MIKIVSVQKLHHLFGDFQLNLYQLSGEEHYTLIIQEKEAAPLSVMGAKADGNLTFGSENILATGNSFIISEIELADLKNLHTQLGSFMAKAEAPATERCAINFPGK